MKKKSRLQPEDILIEENFSELTMIEKSKGTNKNDQHTISRIYSFLTSEQSVLSEIEREQTKNRVKVSVNKFKWKRQLIRLSAAAAILCIFALSGILYSQFNSKSEINRFAQSLQNVSPEQNTRLILQDGQEVRIDQENSEISYAKNGKIITIGKDLNVNQNITSQKQSFNTVIVPYGKRSFITLSEGTKVWLNSGSKLIYPALFAKNMREVYIDGEAAFDVTHSEGSPFYVKTLNFSVKVLGTVFNVCAYADDKISSTVLESGKVELSYNGNDILHARTLSISPGTLAEYDAVKKSFSQQQVNPNEYMSWKNGYLIFRSEKLVNILKKLNRYYNVEILLESDQLQNETFSGNLDLKNTPEQVLEVIAQTTPLNYEYQNSKLVLTSKK